MNDNDPFLSTYLLYMLASVSEAASNEFHTTVRRAGYRIPEWRVFGALYDEDGKMLTALGRIALVEQSAMTKIVSQMEEKGFVTRRGDASDKRRVRVFLTERGRQIAENLVKEARAHEARLLDSLGPEKSEQIKDALHGLMERLNLDGRV